jgi:hypothetical protein
MLTLSRNPGESIKIGDDSTNLSEYHYNNAVIYKLINY